MHSQLSQLAVGPVGVDMPEKSQKNGKSKKAPRMYRYVIVGIKTLILPKITLFESSST